MEVTDELGNIYYKTYYKRAQGLIKKGRARLVSENRICLTCPPSININNESEDIDMMNQTQEIVEFVRDKINGLYDEYKGAAPGEFDEQIISGMIALNKHLLDTAVKIEALDKLTHLDFSKGVASGKDTEAMVQIYKAILNYQS